MKESYQRGLKFIESLIKMNQEKEENIKKVLELLGLSCICRDLQERKLYFWAMKDHKFE